MVEEDYDKDDFFDWCQLYDKEPDDPSSLTQYFKYRDEEGPGSQAWIQKEWDEMTPSDREGWEHNIIRSFDE